MKYILKNCNLLDGTRDMQVQEGVDVLVEDGKFTQIGKDLAAEGADVVDVKGGYLLPGLINMHVHLAAAGKAPKSEKPTDYKKLVQSLKKFAIVKKVFVSSECKNAKNQLLSGVTTMRAVGGVDDWDGIVRDKINAGQSLGPRVLSANMAISVPGGHFAGSLATETKSPEEAKTDAQMVIDSKPDLFKLMITGGVMDASEAGEPGALRMSPEIVKVACDAAHAAGLKVAAHVESSEGVRVALENGVDTIEHGAVPDDEIIKLFKERGAADICTISPALPYSLMDLETAKCGELGRHNGQIVMNGIIECAKVCLKEGIPVGLGTDTGCPFITHYDMWREILYFSHFCGVTPAFAIHTSTLINAQILGLDSEIGSIEVGKNADFIVCEKSPLKDLSRLRTLEMVARDGKIIYKPQPTRMKDVDAALDSIKL